MKTKCLAIAIAAILIVTAASVLATAAPASWPSLPPDQVHLTAVYGVDSYFISTLGLVPNGYDVHNGIYPGWCVDRTTGMNRGVPHSVKLYSSLSPPEELNGINWIAINYILNHKQGDMMDVQNAIWHFTEDNYTPQGGYSAVAQAMIDAANSHPGYDPLTGTVLAIICYRQNDEEGVQNSIIELSHGLGLSPGYWKHNVNVYNGGKGSFSGDPHITRQQLEAYAQYIATNFSPGFTLQNAQQIFQDNKQHAQWLTVANWFNAAAGLPPYSDD